MKLWEPCAAAAHPGFHTEGGGGGAHWDFPTPVIIFLLCILIWSHGSVYSSRVALLPTHRITGEELDRALKETVQNIVQEFLQPEHFGLIPRPT